MAQNPSSVFFWNDWDQEPGLRLCSLAAQGLWMRCLCVMARARPAGYLVIGSRPCTEGELAQLVNEPQAMVAALLDELRRNEVFSITRSGTIYSRRMVREASLSEKRARSGRIGGIANQRNRKEERDLLEQKAKQNSSKPQAPLSLVTLVTHTNSESNHDPPVSDNAPVGAAKNGKRYAFEGMVIKLLPRDFARWRQAYAHLELEPELTALDDFYVANLTPDERKDWFYRCSQALANRNERAGATKGSGNGNGKREDWYGRRVLDRAVRRAAEAEAEPRAGLDELEGRAPIWGG